MKEFFKDLFSADNALLLVCMLVTAVLSYIVLEQRSLRKKERALSESDKRWSLVAESVVVSFLPEELYPTLSEFLEGEIDSEEYIDEVARVAEKRKNKKPGLVQALVEKEEKE